MIKKEIRRVILDKLMALGNVNGNLHFSDFSKLTSGKKLFCSDECRRRWWKEHPDRKTIKIPL